MLAQNFKSAVDLRITEPQLAALIKVLVLLETGKLVHTQDDYGYNHGAEEKFSGHFNMARWNLPTGCGTISCIGGTAELISGENFAAYEYSFHPIEELFWPRKIQPIWLDITPDQAATALRSYLTTGDPRWDLAVAL